MFVFLIVVITLIAIFLTVVVLLQSGKGGGLAGIAAGGATTQILGARTAPDVLEKATWALASVFIFLCLISNFFISRGDQAIESVVQQGQPTAPLTTPGQLDASPIDPGAAATPEGAASGGATGGAQSTPPDN